MTKMYVKAEDFVKAVQEAAENNETWSDVAAKLGLKVESCTVRASQLRKIGRENPDLASLANLPKLKKTSNSRGRKTDYVALAKMVSDYSAKQAQATNSPETPVVETVVETSAEVVAETTVENPVIQGQDGVVV